MTLLNAAALLTKPVRIELDFSTDDTETATSSRFSRVHLVERILELNPTATPEFLSRFTHSSLIEYLDHLTLTQAPRGKGSQWVRRCGVPAIVGRTSRV